jgi:DNA modification methylase
MPELRPFTFTRLPKSLQKHLRASTAPTLPGQALKVNEIHHGDARELLWRIKPNSVAVSVWSPPYFVGKSYEVHMTFDEWKALLRDVIQAHWHSLKPGGFVVINIADILCFRDASMPRIQAETVSSHRSRVTRDDVLGAMAQHPGATRYELAEILGCSEQTIDRRLNGNNIRGGKYKSQTRVKLVGGLIEEWGSSAGFYLYDRRIWAKDAAWENSRWASLSYRSVDESEYLYFFWKPGVTKVDRSRLTPAEWKEWGSRGVWRFPSVHANDDHEAKFPVELPRRVIRLLSDPGDLILDCFMGSGTTALAAIETGRQFIGIELDCKAVTLAKTNVAVA